MDYKKLSRVVDSSKYDSLLKELEKLGCIVEGKLDESRAADVIKKAAYSLDGRNFDTTPTFDGCGLRVGKGYARDIMGIRLGAADLLDLRFMKGGKLTFQWHWSRYNDQLKSKEKELKDAIMSVDYTKPLNVIGAINSVVSKKECAKIAYEGLLNCMAELKNFLNIDGQECISIIGWSLDNPYKGFIYRDKKNLYVWGNEKENISADEALEYINSNPSEGTGYLQFVKSDYTQDGAIIVEPLAYKE